MRKFCHTLDKEEKSSDIYIYIYIYIYIFMYIFIFIFMSESYVLLICPTFRYATLCERIEHYTARIDYNKDLFIYIYIYICIYKM